MAKAKVVKVDPPPITGVCHITGETDTGKTTFILTVPQTLPKDIIFFDDDVKTNKVASKFEERGTPFRAYHDLTLEFKQRPKHSPLEFYHFIDELVSKYEQEAKDGNPARVLGWDNWTRVEQAIRSYSMTRMNELTDMSPGQIRSMSRMTWPATYQVYQEFLLRLLNIAPLVMLTTHTREAYNKPGVLEARGQRPLTEKSTFRVWLRHNPDGPEPIGLVLKRVQKLDVVDGRIVPVNVLPRRVKPFTWDKIVEYYEDPVGLREPRDDERPNAFELSILDGTLTDDQKDAMRLALKIEERTSGDDEEAALFAEQEMSNKAIELAKDGKSLPEIVKELAGGATPAEVAKWIKDM